MFFVPQKSYGKMRGTRKKLRLGKKPGTTRFLQSFQPGDTVHIKFITTKKIQHPRFHGMTGKVIEKRGRSYAVQIRDGSVLKTLFVRPEHLKLQK